MKQLFLGGTFHRDGSVIFERKMEYSNKFLLSFFSGHYFGWLAHLTYSSLGYVMASSGRKDVACCGRRTFRSCGPRYWWDPSSFGVAAIVFWNSSFDFVPISWWMSRHLQSDWTMIKIWMKHLNVMGQIWFIFIPIDSPLNSLSLVFWTQIDTVNRYVTIWSQRHGVARGRCYNLTAKFAFSILKFNKPLVHSLHWTRSNWLCIYSYCSHLCVISCSWLTANDHLVTDHRAHVITLFSRPSNVAIPMTTLQ